MCYLTRLLNHTKHQPIPVAGKFPNTLLYLFHSCLGYRGNYSMAIDLVLTVEVFLILIFIKPKLSFNTLMGGKGIIPFTIKQLQNCHRMVRNFAKMPHSPHYCASHSDFLVIFFMITVFICIVSLSIYHFII